jgi:hypothetical protein
MNDFDDLVYQLVKGYAFVRTNGRLDGLTNDDLTNELFDFLNLELKPGNTKAGKCDSLELLQNPMCQTPCSTIKGIKGFVSVQIRVEFVTDLHSVPAGVRYQIIQSFPMDQSSYQTMIELKFYRA